MQLVEPSPMPLITLPSGRKIDPTRKYYVRAGWGAVLIGITLPCLLVSLRMINESTTGFHFGFLPLLLIANIGCSGFAVALSHFLLRILAQPGKYETLRELMSAGVRYGIAMAFLNVPGYGVIYVLDTDTFAIARVALLFAVAGASCGIWIAWQAWCIPHPDERFFPRFTLATLLLVVALWGTVMLVFQPRPKPSSDHTFDGD